MTVKYLVTHSGGFHADEVMSSVILTRLFPQAEIVRSRAADWITPGADRIIYDVGGAYDVDQHIFDHHQRGAPLRDDGQPLSSFGLIWRHFGRAYLAGFEIAQADIDAVHGSFDKSFVLPIDLVDNGALSPSAAGALASMTLPGLIETLKPVFDDQDPESERRAFDAAVMIARHFVEARVARNAAKIRADGIVEAAIAQAGAGHVLELPMGMPFRPSVIKAGADHLLFVVTPRGGTEWTIGGIRLHEDGFEQRADLPAAWAGLNGAELEAVSGVEGAIFCHNGRFIAAAKTREAILAMANLAVKEALAAR